LTQQVGGGIVVSTRREELLVSICSNIKVVFENNSP
jgi:hypothetical protein